jgi:hypothetical protein
MPIAFLPERGVIKIEGNDARAFLHGLITCDIGRVSPEKAGFGALLTPQGKIIADFLICEAPEVDGGGFFLDCVVTRIAELLKRVKLYKLRADVTVTDMTETLAILALWDGSVIANEHGLVFSDSRNASLGDRAIVERSRAEDLSDSGSKAYHLHRIAQGVPDGGKDYSYEDAFPHEALLDQLGGVDFRKGCYVGQEVVSRMEHRGTARTRIVPVRFAGGFVCEWGIEATAGGKSIGRMGSTGKGRGLALLRLDRVIDAIKAEHALMAGGLEFTVEPAALARFAPVAVA